MDPGPLSDVELAAMSTDPVELATLAKRSKSHMIRRNVARNPNTPVEVLLVLAEKVNDPEYNDIYVDSLYITDTGKWTHASIQTRVSAMSHPKFPLGRLLELAKKNGMARDVLRSKDILSDLLDE